MRRGTPTSKATTPARGRRLSPSSKARLTIASVTVVGLLCWTVVPGFASSLGADDGDRDCRMPCAGTPGCCCKPEPAPEEPRIDVPLAAEVLEPESKESCPRDCATLTVVTGVSTARTAGGIHRIDGPPSIGVLRAVAPHAAIDQHLLDVARPRGPPAPVRSRLGLACRRSNTTTGPPSITTEFPMKNSPTRGSSAPEHCCARRSVPSSTHGFRDSVFVVLSTTIASRHDEGFERRGCVEVWGTT
jgi:hypothetical protein